MIDCLDSEPPGLAGGQGFNGFFQWFSWHGLSAFACWRFLRISGRLILRKRVSLE
jgi:hypothetical protein